MEVVRRGLDWKECGEGVARKLYAQCKVARSFARVNTYSPFSWSIATL